MADLIGHPWMLGDTATQEEIAVEFSERHEMLEAPQEDRPVNQGNSMDNRTRRGNGVKVQNYIFISGDLTEEENK